MPDGKKLSGKRFLAVALWELVTTGRVTMPDGVTWTVDPRDWLETVKWLYVHIDGPAKQAHELSGPDNGPIHVIFEEVERWRGGGDSLSVAEDASGPESSL